MILNLPKKIDLLSARTIAYNVDYGHGNGIIYTDPFGMVGQVTMSYYLKATAASGGTIQIDFEGRLPDGTWAQPGVAGNEGAVLAPTVADAGLDFFDRVAGMPYTETCRLKITVATASVVVTKLTINIS